jgi:phytoene dehydrogenase-like protein
MANKKTIIIGAGIAGLSAGCYLQMNGYDTEIFESHNLPGGLCTAWKRKGYTIEGAIHGLLGSSQANPFYGLWNELIEMNKIEFVDYDVQAVFEFEDKQRFHLYTDLNRLEKYMKDLSPQDREVIDEFINGVRRVQKLQMPVGKPREFMNFIDYLKMVQYIPMLSFMKKWLRVSADDFSKRFKSPFLQKAVKNFSSPILFEMFVLYAMDLKTSGYPTIGSQEFARLFENKYLSLGGKINYNSKVSKIIEKDNKAVGVQLENGTISNADIIVSAADGRTTVFNMLEGKYVNEEILNAYKNMKLNTSRVQVSLGIARTFENEPHLIKYVLDESFSISDGTNFSSIDVQIFNRNRTASPEGKTLLEVQFETSNGEYWIELRAQDLEKYLSAKNTVAQDLINILEEKMGNIRNKVEMVDVVTPATYNRYTGNWKGSIQGWANEKIFEKNPFKKELPNISNLFITGQWVEPGGGVPTVFKSGRDIAQIICKKDKKKFKTH